MFYKSTFSNVSHAFGSRNGGVSTGYLQSMNFALKGFDTNENVEKNREILMQTMGYERLLTVEQVHSNKVAIITEPWEFLDPATPKVDALITQLPGVAIGIITADCVPILIHDPVNKTIAAVHSGWRGTFSGVIANTITAMQSLGCRVENLSCAIGPCIQQDNYEVSPDLYNDEYKQFFKPNSKPNHYLLDLPGIIEEQLRQQGVSNIDNTKICTYANPDKYFSCRRAFHKGEAMFGCQISVIAL